MKIKKMLNQLASPYPLLLCEMDLGQRDQIVPFLIRKRTLFSLNLSIQLPNQRSREYIKYRLATMML